MKSATFGALLAPLAFVAVLAFPGQSHAATLSFSAPTSVSVGETFAVKVRLSSTKDAFNAAEATISFPKNLLQITSIDSSAASTIFNFWLGYPGFSNENGVATFSGGTVNAVSGENVPVLTLNMRAIAAGEATLYADSASVNASNGSGTNVLTEITPARIVVQPKTTVLPPAPVSTAVPKQTQTPTPAPLPVAPAVAPAATTSQGAAQSEAKAPGPQACSQIFGVCTLRFPTITSVSVEQHVSNGADILASGSAPAGDVVHLVLTQNGVPYENETVVLKGDTWEARLPNITAFGSFELEAWVENADGTMHSDTFVWPDVHVYPPFTFEVFGYALHWYTLVSVFFILLTAVLGGILLLRHAERRGPWSLWNPVTIAYGGVVIVTIIVLGVSYAFWQHDHFPAVRYWKDTTVPCLSHSHAVDDHGFAHLSIFIDGVPQLIPAGIGISPKCTADIHTHDNTGRLHLHLHMDAPRATLADFFAVAGEPLVRQGYRLLVMINGENYTQRASTYELQDGDEIVVSYTSIGTSTPSQ